MRILVRANGLCMKAGFAESGALIASRYRWRHQSLEFIIYSLSMDLQKRMYLRAVEGGEGAQDRSLNPRKKAYIQTGNVMPSNETI